MAKKLVLGGGTIMLLNSAYLGSFSDPTIAFVLNVLLHVGLGVLFLGLLAWLHAIDRRCCAMAVVLAAAGLGLYLAIFAATRDHRAFLWGHIGFSVLAMVLLAGTLFARGLPWRGYAVLLIACVAFPFGISEYRKFRPNPMDRIHNPALVPVSMDEEGDGVKGPFFPSSATTNTGGKIPSNFFMDSESCRECHRDIYDQWQGSMHH